jgi:AcrR family transcriptional regulator
MSNKRPAPVRKPKVVRRDSRVARSTQALGRALIELVEERGFETITVQQILDRAGVGRATFYAHFRNKEDVLHSSFEQLFLACERMLPAPSARERRLFPVKEFVSHIRDAERLAHALRSDGRMEEMWQLFTGYATRIIGARLSSRRGDDDAGRQVVAVMLAGALVEMLKWADAHPSAATPEELDVRFHALARGAM